MTPSESLPLFLAACADVKIAPGAFNPEPGCFCPVGALGATVPKRAPLEGLHSRAARRLGIGVQEALAVALAFDGPPGDSFYGEWVMLGRELRRRWEAGGLGAQR